MGYVKRETPAAPRLHAKKREEERLAEKRTPLPKPPPIKTENEKEELRKKMKDKVLTHTQYYSTINSIAYPSMKRSTTYQREFYSWP